MEENHLEKVGDCFVEHIAFEPPRRVISNVVEIKFSSLGEEVVLESPEGDRVTLSLHSMTNNLAIEKQERTLIVPTPSQYVMLEGEHYRPAPSSHEPEV